MTSRPPTEYLIQRLQDALATDARTGELGLEVEATDDGLVVKGVVGSEERRAAILEVARDTVPEVPVSNETAVKQVRPPQEQERIS